MKLLTILAAVLLSCAIVLAVVHGHWLSAIYSAVLLVGLPTLYHAGTYRP